MQRILKARKIARLLAEDSGAPLITELCHERLSTGVRVYVRTGRAGNNLYGTAFVPDTGKPTFRLT